MFHKIAKKFFHFLINLVQGIQVSLVFLAFFVILYWILQIAGATFLTPVAPFFEGIKAIIHTFYSRTVTIDKVTVDFSFLLASFLILLIAQSLKLLAESIEFLEKKYDSIYKYFKNKAESLFNIGLEKDYLAHEKRNNKFLLFIQFNLANLNKDKFFDKDVEVGVDEKQKEVAKEFYETFGKDLKFEKGFTKEGLLYYFNDFANIEKVISEVVNSTGALRAKYAKEKWQVSYLAGIDVYENSNEVALKARKLVMLSKLELKNKIACLATFKQRYALIKSPLYKVEGRGTYKIDKNEDVYVIEV